MTLQIKRFIDRVNSQNGTVGREVILTIQDARMLRDELVRLTTKNVSVDEVVEVEIRGGSFK